MSRKLNKKKVSPKNISAAIKIVEEISPPNLAGAEDLIINDDLTVELNYGSYIERLQNGKTEIFHIEAGAAETIQLNLVMEEPTDGLKLD